MRFSSHFLSKCFEQEIHLNADSISTDSRSIQNHEAFVAIKGERFDGHDFVDQAIKAGARFAIVEESGLAKVKADKSKLIIVKNSIEALRKMAAAYRDLLSCKIFAIGGSNGKTTTKEFLAFLCSQLLGAERVFKTKKSENSILGVAISLLQIKNEEVAILEVGIDEAGWMEKHLHLIRPHYGLITSIQEEHLERLKSIENVAKEELKLLEYLKENNGCFAANVDSQWIKSEKFPQTSLRYSLDERADIEGLFQGNQYLHAFGLLWKNPLPGKHNAQNLLAALTGLRLIFPDLSMDQLKQLHSQIHQFKGEAHRSNWIELPNQIYIFDDCYNANPGSMESSLMTFQELSHGHPRRLVVLGDMLDLGEQSEQAHRRILNLAIVLGFDEILLFGLHFEKAFKLLPAREAKNVKSFTDYPSLEEYLKSRVQERHSIFLKGSRGMRLERLLSIWSSKT